MSSHHLKRIVAATLSRVALISCLLPLTGCAYFEWIGIVFFPEKNIALHEIAPRRTLIWFELKSSSSMLRPDIMSYHTADQLGLEMDGELLLTHEAMRDKGDFGGMSIAKVGAKVGADQVLYARLQQESLEIGPGYHGAEVTAHVRMIETETGRRLFPIGATHSGYPLKVTIPQRITSRTSHSMRDELRNTLESEISRQIALLFITHIPEPGSRSGKYFGKSGEKTDKSRVTTQPLKRKFGEAE